MMTRLTDDMVKGISTSIDEVSMNLVRSTGMDMRQLAFDAVGIDEDSIDLGAFRVAVIPVTSGLGVISGFSRSVSDIAGKLGMDSFVTEASDVTGLAEALAADVDMIFMADDYEFIAYNTRARRYSNNSFSTAAGYVSALNGASGGVRGKDVLVLGAGRVGTEAVGLLSDMGANVTVSDPDSTKAISLASSIGGVVYMDDIDKAISTHMLILNASPAPIPGKSIKQGSVISSPGIPHAFDEEGIKKARTIIHDPLDIGVSVMAVQSASFSYPDIKRRR